jgi:hypothetical protein
MAGTREAGDPLTANRLAMLDATGELCRLLARRGWFNQGGSFGFHSGADDARFRALTAQRLRIAGEAAQIERTVRDRMAAGREMVRDVLSRSIFSGG